MEFVNLRTLGGRIIQPIRPPVKTFFCNVPLQVSRTRDNAVKILSTHKIFPPILATYTRHRNEDGIFTDLV